VGGWLGPRAAAGRRAGRPAGRLGVVDHRPPGRRGCDRPRPVGRARLHPRPVTEEVDVVIVGRRVRRHAHRHQPASRPGHHRLPHRRQGRRLRRHLVLEPLPGLHVRRRVATSTSRCSRRRATCPPRSTPARPRSSSTASASAATSTSTPTRCSRPRSTPPTWDDDAHRWRVTTTGATAPRPGSSSPPAASSTRPSCPASTASTDFAGQGVPHRPLGLRLHRRQPHRADGPPGRQASSASSAPARPRCRSCRSWPESAKEVYVFQRTPSAVGVRGNAADRRGVVRRWSRAGRPSACATSPRRSPASSPTATWSATAGPRCCGRTPRREAASRRSGPSSSADFETMEGCGPHRRDRRGPGHRRGSSPGTASTASGICFHDEYLQSFNEPNVHLVDTDGRGVREMSPPPGRSSTASSTRSTCSCTRRASRSPPAWSSRLGFDPVGRGGVRLSERWHDGAHTLHGVLTAEFPNLLRLPASSRPGSG
jgi:hypothetical protein